MNLSQRKNYLQKFYYPVGFFLYKLRFPPNIITFLSLLTGTAAALFYYYENLLTAGFFLILSGLLDLADGLVARLAEKTTKFGAVFDWVADKWVDGLVLGIIGYFYAGPFVATLAVTLSLIHSFIKPVVYSEIGYERKINGKISDPLENIGFFGRPETHISLIFFTLMEKLGAPAGLAFGIKFITIGTFLSLLVRIFYLYKHFGKIYDR
ncbi:MAG: CDP-alcohol phosphatidyltransferase family protein [Thermodesulfobacteriaceae bacterium]|nr:CDP-alcohol phosphatidyltransferase family protein [Thermodesulfobacteriaceae bacterium]MCX8042233.1 CDP-alcohol phosphatidyltransferase family protein [Thermodesulfobacteriaceae bacterium]MDW8136312.1 CDP-alcohol phosphatidyltransferase family protein [Thermodesulfobacterium sp.]